MNNIVDEARPKRKYTKRSPKWAQRSAEAAERHVVCPTPKKRRDDKLEASSERSKSKKVRVEKVNPKISKRDQAKIDKKLKAEKEAFLLLKIAARDFGIKIANCKKAETRTKLIENAAKRNFNVEITEDAVKVTPIFNVTTKLKVKIPVEKKTEEIEKPKNNETKVEDISTKADEVIEPEVVSPVEIAVDPAKFEKLSSSFEEPTEEELREIEAEDDLENLDEEDEFEDDEDTDVDEEDDFDDRRGRSRYDDDLADYRREFFTNMSDMGNGFDD